MWTAPSDSSLGPPSALPRPWQHLGQQNISAVARGYLFIQIAEVARAVEVARAASDHLLAPTPSSHAPHLAHERRVGFESEDMVAWQGELSCWAPMNHDAVLEFSRALSALSSVE
jgi:hypothetical protein